MNTINFDDIDKIEQLNSRVAELLAEVAALKRVAQGALPASLRSELIQLEAVVHDARCSNEVIGMRIRNTWDTYRHAINSAVTSTQPYPTENMPADGGGK